MTAITVIWYQLLPTCFYANVQGVARDYIA